jgi:hypothetical protein
MIHDNAERPPVDLNLIQRQINGIIAYLKEHVWKDQLKPENTPTEDAAKTP